jgi:hypothetical protein
MFNSQAPPRRSQAPASRVRGESVARAREREATLLQQIAAFLARSSVTLKPETRAWLESVVREAKAEALGRKVTPRGIARRWLREAEALEAAIVAGKVKGYGAARLHYAGGLALTLAQSGDALNDGRATQLGRSAEVQRETERADRVRSTATAVLENLHVDDDTKERSLQSVRKGDNKDARADSLEELLRQLKARVAAVPEQVSEDAGAHEVIEELQAVCDTSAAAVRAHETQQRAVATTASGLHVLKGRLVFELAAMRKATRGTRRTNASVPTLTPARKHRTTGKRTAAAPAPAPAPTPTPDAQPKPSPTEPQ